MESPENRKIAARAYFDSQTRGDETIVHLERVANERLLGEEFDVWDAHTDKGRWWVISSPMNLYTQEDFKSMDVALSFHIGLTRRAMAKFSPAPVADGDGGRFAKTWRRIEQVDDAVEHADEAEQFQAIGMQCRETLLAFARELATDEMKEGEAELPKAGDFKGWAALVARRIEPRDRPRAYLKATATEAWDYVSWLTHAQNATRHDAREAIGATIRTVMTLAGAVVRWERGDPERCPECGSYRLVEGEPRFSEDDPFAYEDVTLCEGCGWEDVEPGQYTDEQKVRMLDYLTAPPPAGDCLLSSEISTFMSPQDFIDRNA